MGKGLEQANTEISLDMAKIKRLYTVLEWVVGHPGPASPTLYLDLDAPELLHSYVYFNTWQVNLFISLLTELFKGILIHFIPQNPIQCLA